MIALIPKERQLLRARVERRGTGPDSEWTVRGPNRGKCVGVGAARQWGIQGREPVVNRAESTIAARCTNHDA